MPSADAQCATADGGKSSGDVVIVHANGPGRFFLGGNQIDGPWTLAYDHGRLTVNGYTLRPRPPQPPAPPNPARKAETDFIHRVEARANSLRGSDLTVAQRVHQLASFCMADSLTAVVDTSPGAVMLTTRGGLPMLFLLTSVPKTGRTISTDELRRMIDEKDDRKARIEHLKRMLEKGCVVFIAGSGFEVTTLRVGEFMAAVDKLRSGVEPDSTDRITIPRWVKEQIRRPLPLDQIW